MINAQEHQPTELLKPDKAVSPRATELQQRLDKMMIAAAGEKQDNPNETVRDTAPIEHVLDTAIKRLDSVREHNVGDSDYAQHKIQPWDIWIEYDMNPFDADIVKRVLRNKPSDSRVLDYKKIIHICEERIRQLES